MFINFFKIIFLLVANLTLAQDFNNRNNPALVSIIPSNGIFLVEENYYFGVKIELQKGWKTYWKNPGDAGAPITVEFDDVSAVYTINSLYSNSLSWTFCMSCMYLFIAFTCLVVNGVLDFLGSMLNFL